MRKVLIVLFILLAAACARKDADVYPTPETTGAFTLFISKGFLEPEEAAARYTLIERLRAESANPVVVDAMEQARPDSLEERLYAAMGYDYIIGGEPVILERNGLKIGLFTFTGDVKSARATVKQLRLRDDCDTVVAVTALPDRLDGSVNGIDITASVAADGIRIMEYSRGETVTVSEKKDDLKNTPPNAMIWRMMEGFGGNPVFEVVAIAPYGFLPIKNQPRVREDSSVNLITDAMYWYANEVLDKNIDFAMMTGGSVFHIRPYPYAFTKEGAGRDNSTNLGAVMRNREEPEIILTIKGQDLLGVLEQGAKNRRTGGFSQYSAQLRVEMTDDGHTITLDSALLNGGEIEAEKLYRFTLNEYAASGKDGYGDALEGKVLARESIDSLSKALDAYAAHKSRIVPYTDGRMVIREEHPEYD